MQHENDYSVIITNEGPLVFIIKARDTEPESPFLLYDGGNHATFYRGEHETVLFDFLNEQVVPILQKAESIVVFEVDDKSEDISRDSTAGVKHIKKNVFTDGLKTAAMQ